MKECQMETIAVRETLPALTDSQALLEKCTSDAADPADIYQELTLLFKQVSQEIARSGYEDYIARLTNSLNDLAGQLRKFTRKQNSIRYYYFGMFQAWSDTLKEQNAKEQEERQLLSVITRKHAGEIMRYLYQNENAQHKELVSSISIQPSNLSAEMSILIDAGLVRRQKMGKYVYYSLTAPGIRACKRYLKPGSFSPTTKETEKSVHSFLIAYNQKGRQKSINFYSIPFEPDSSSEKSEKGSIIFASRKRECALYEPILLSITAKEEKSKC